jgi:hypothetical protein
MNCSDFIRRLTDGSSPDAPLRDHLSGCANCREMLATWDSNDRPDPARIASIQREIVSRWRPVKPIASGATLLLALLLLFFAFSIGAPALIGFLSLHRLTPWRMAIYYSGLALCATAAAVVVVQFMVPGAKTRLNPRYTTLLIGIAMVGAVLLLFPNFSTAFFATGIACFCTGSIAAAVAALLFATVLRRTFPSTPVAASAAIGFFAGLCGVSVLALHCGYLNTPHILVWHFGVLVVATLGGVFVGYLAEWLGRKKFLAYRNS